MLGLIFQQQLAERALKVGGWLHENQDFKLSPESLPKLLFNLESLDPWFLFLGLLLSSDYACVQPLEPVFTVSTDKMRFCEM